MFEFLLAYILSLCIGILASITGLGGGFLYVPTLTLVFGLDPRVAIGTSLAIMIFSSLSASIWYHRQGIILFRVSLILMIPSMIFSIIGSFISTLFDVRVIIAFFCLMLIMVSLELLVPRFRFLREIRIGPSFVLTAKVPTRENQPIIRIWYSHLFFWGAVGGLISGMTGTSGGAIFVPALATAGIPMHYAVATSMLTIILVAITGTLTHATVGNISLPYIAVYGAGAALGAFIGANIAPEIKDSQIKIVLGVVLLVIAAIMFYQKVLML
jgi:uncharacterized membrane protein YfcA